MTDIAQFLAALYHHDDVLEVRLLPGGRKVWSTPADFEGIEHDLQRENAAGKNVYIGANPRREVGGSKAADVLLARAVCADFDGGITPADALARVEAASLPTPTVTLTTGGGTHCWWRLAEPLDDLAAWTETQKRIARATGSDKVIHDAPRIMRLPGFVNHKYPDKPVAAIVDCDAARVYPVEVFTTLPGRRSEPVATADPGCSRTMSAHSRGFLEEGAVDEDGRRATAFKVACDLAGRGWSEAEAADAIEARLHSLGIEGEELADVRRQVRNAFKVPRDPRGGTAAPAVTPTAPAIEWQPFPVDALPEPVATFVREAAEGIGADETMVALPLLATLAAAVGNTRRVELKPGWLEPPVLWCATVGESGDGKTPGFLAALQFIEAEQQERFRDHARDVALWEAEVADHDAAVADWRRARGKQGAPDHPGEKPTRPTPTRYLVNDATLEALVAVLAANPRGLLLAADELAGWLASFDQYRSGRGGSDCPRWLSMHTAGAVTVDRKLTGTLHVPSAAVSVVGGIQPGTLARALGTQHVENGLLARLVLAMPPSRPPQWSTTSPSFVTLEDMRRLFCSLLAVPAGAAPSLVDLDADATEVFKAYWLALAEEREATTGPVRSMLAKVAALAGRLALVIHTVEQARDGGLAVPGRISAATMDRAVVLARWAARENRRTYAVVLDGEGVASTATDDAAAVDWIAARGGFTTVRDLGRGLVRFKAPGAAEAVARRLVGAGRAVWEAPTRGGRPADGIRLAGGGGAKTVDWQ